MVTKMITWGPSSKSYSSGDYKTFQLGDPIYDGRYVANTRVELPTPEDPLSNCITQYSRAFWMILPTMT